MATPGWFKDAGDLAVDFFTDPTTLFLGPQNAVGKETLERTGEAFRTPKDPTALALNQGVNYGVGALKDIAFDDQGNLIIPEYRGPGQLSQSAMDAMAARAQNDPMQALSERYYADALGGGPNPYLDAMYNKAAGKVRADLSSQFERSGRYGGTDMALAMGESLGNLATDIYGKSYESEMARRERAAQMAPSAGYQGLQRQLAIGQMQDQQGQEAADWEYSRGMQAINEYLTNLGVAKGGFVQMPQRNRAAETLGILSSIGSIAGGPIGGALGAGAAGAGAIDWASMPDDYTTPRWY